MTTPGSEHQALDVEAMDFESFYRAAKDGCLRAVLMVTMNAEWAEDLTGEAFTRALQHWDRLRHHPCPEGWVVRTAVNLHRDGHRRWVRLQRLLPRLHAQPVTAPDVPLDDALARALRQLPRRQREVLALRVLLDLPAQETAELLGISAGSVGTHLHRAIAALRSQLCPDANSEWCTITPRSRMEALS